MLLTLDLPRTRRGRPCGLAFAAVVAAIGLLGASCSSDQADVAGIGILVIDDEAVRLCTRYIANTRQCIEPIIELDPRSVVDTTDIDMIERTGHRYSSTEVELVNPSFDLDSYTARVLPIG
ncbi:MAG: hypothetical protein AAGG08_06315 [Actinomycetota bacterium]